MLRLGGNVDSWCGKCKLLLAHTIEAMVDNKPARVLCNTCRTAHNYKPGEPREPKKTLRKTSQPQAGGPIAAPSGKTRASRYEILLRGKNVALAKHYSPKDNYALGDVMAHPIFGVGVTVDLKDGAKIEVLFEAGPKLLIHSR